jgi:predicted small lipoprotein YifL
MKKLFQIVFTLILIFSLAAACGTPGETAEPTAAATPLITPEQSPPQTPVVTPELTPKATPEPTPEVTPEPIPAVTPQPTPAVTPQPVPAATTRPEPVFDDSLFWDFYIADVILDSGDGNIYVEIENTMYAKFETVFAVIPADYATAYFEKLYVGSTLSLNINAYAEYLDDEILLYPNADEVFAK